MSTNTDASDSGANASTASSLTPLNAEIPQSVYDVMETKLKQIETAESELATKLSKTTDDLERLDLEKKYITMCNVYRADVAEALGNKAQVEQIKQLQQSMEATWESERKTIDTRCKIAEYAETGTAAK